MKARTRQQEERCSVGTEENKALVSRLYAALDSGEVDALDELLAEDYVDFLTLAAYELID